MSLRIKVDEDLPRAVALNLRTAGHDVTTVLDEGLGGTKDGPLWAHVQSEGRFLVTRDKGFADIRRYPPGSHHGVLLLRPERDGISPLIDLLDRVVLLGPLDPLARGIAVATPRGLRIRPEAR